MTSRFENDQEHFIEEFSKYADRRNFSDSLRRYCIETLRRSYKCGDGALRSDSLFSVLLEDNTSVAPALISPLVGIRGSLLSEIRFDETLARQHLIFNPCFQTPL